MGQAARRLQCISAVENVLRGSLQRVRVNRRRPDDEPLGQIDKVWGDVSAGVHAGGDQRGVDHRGDGALAVRAGDVERRERPFGMPQRGAQPGDVVEPELDPERVEREEAVEQLSAAASRRRRPPPPSGVGRLARTPPA